MIASQTTLCCLRCCSISASKGNVEGIVMPIWKYVFGMMAMSMYMDTPLVFIIPGGVMVVE